MQSKSSGAGGRIHWRQVAILYRRELRGAMREKAIVINSILIPLFLYPFILWAAFTGLMFVMGQTEGKLSRVEVRDWPPKHAELRRAFERDKQIQLAKALDTTNSAQTKIKNGTLDAFVEFLPATGTNAALPGNFQARITFDESKERSSTARDRVKGLIRDYRFAWLERDARSRGISPAQWQWFSVLTHNAASPKQVGAFALGMMLPSLFVIMVALGCVYPAIDSTAGERERNTWETLMSTGTNRITIATAKYLYVCTMSGLAGTLNLIAILVTIKPILMPLLARAGQSISFTLSPMAVPFLFLAALLLAGFVAAGMMIFASFARTFKEGQAMVTPFFLVILLPVMFLQMPGIRFSLPLALCPVVNVTLMVRNAISGTLGWVPCVVTVIVSLLVILLCIRLATFILQFEDFLMGSQSGGLRNFLRKRVFNRTPAAPPTKA